MRSRTSSHYARNGATRSRDARNRAQRHAAGAIIYDRVVPALATWSDQGRATLAAGAASMAGALRRARPRSLRAQLALGSSLLALCSVLVVAVVTLTVLAVTFSSYQQSLLSTEAAQLAAGIGSGTPASSASPSAPGYGTYKGAGVGPLGDVHRGAEVWVMDASGHLYVPHGAASEMALQEDEPHIVAMLQAALGGQSSEKQLSTAIFAPLSQRFAAAVPVRQGGGTTGKIIEAVALSTPPSSDRGSLFTGAVATGVIAASVMVVLLAAVAALVFASQLTRPLTRLATAAKRMERGDYQTRVTLTAPEEYAALAGSFNEMAGALERDVAELHRQEALRREMVANISHELATPLTAISGFSEALLDDVGDAAQQEESLQHIAREAARLRRLVDQLREVTRLEAVAPTLERSVVPLASLVDATVAVVAPEAERSGVSIINAVSAELPSVFADADRLTEVLLNLLDNALRHTPSGGRITIDGRQETDMLRVSVSDTGPGIPPTERARVFDRFYRIDPSRAMATGGTGLGLSIVRGLVEAHGGRVWVEDAPGGGARFTFTLPVGGAGN